MSFVNEEIDLARINYDKQTYLLKRIKEDEDFLLEKEKELGYGSELRLVLSKSRDEFFFTAPEEFDNFFSILSNYIELDYDEYYKPQSPNIRKNIYGEPIRCFKCDKLDHVQKDCPQEVENPTPKKTFLFGFLTLEQLGNLLFVSYIITSIILLLFLYWKFL